MKSLQIGKKQKKKDCKEFGSKLIFQRNYSDNLKLDVLELSNFFMTLKKAKVERKEKTPEFLGKLIFKKTEARNSTDGNQETMLN